MGIFAPTSHPFVGREMIFGTEIESDNHKLYSTTRRQLAEKGERMILFVGDRVTVESAWTRPYLPDGGETLLYIKSHTTGERTHVTAADLH